MTSATGIVHLYQNITVADLEGAEPAPPPRLGDGPTPSLYSW